eukprot:3562890-Amphidinium_carterae.1
MNSSLLAEYAHKEVQPSQSAGPETTLSEADMKVSSVDFSLGNEIAAALREDSTPLAPFRNEGLH